MIGRGAKVLRRPIDGDEQAVRFRDILRGTDAFKEPREDQPRVVLLLDIHVEKNARIESLRKLERGASSPSVCSHDTSG